MQPSVPRPMPACGAQDLTKVFETDGGRVVAVDNVSLAIPEGSFTAIMGPSGSGKSTLMHCMAGLDRPTSGRVFIGQDDIAAMNERQVTRVRRDKVGFIFQSFNLLPTLTAEQNIVLPLELAGRKPDRRLFDEIIASLGIQDRLKHRPSQLSGGQQQRVAIARALITSPQVIFADEPTGALDSKTGTRLLEYLQYTARERGQTIIMVTHDPKAAGYANRALVLLDGRIIDDIASPRPENVLQIMGQLV